MMPFWLGFAYMLRVLVMKYSAVPWQARAILAHFRGGRPDLALSSMGRILDPYAKLFKLDNPIAHQGCGPGMYSQSGGGLSNKDGKPILDVDIFGIPAAFLHGLFGYQYQAGALLLEPTLPEGVAALTQSFPVRFGNTSLYHRRDIGMATEMLD
jgi:hypothetical protein